MHNVKSMTIYIATVIGSIFIGVMIPRLLVMILISLQAALGLNIDDLAPSAYILLFIGGPLLAGVIAILLSNLYYRSNLPSLGMLPLRRNKIAVILGVTSLIVTLFAEIILVCH